MKLKNPPQHVAIIVDGNRRWAKKNNQPSLAGHQKVTDDILEPLVFESLKLGISYLTFWAFSTENWKRGPEFYKPLFKILRSVLKKDVKKYLENGISLKVIGDLSRIPQPLKSLVKKRVSQKPEKTKITVTMALNYGGRDEILRAINRYLSHLRGKRHIHTSVHTSEVCLTEEVLSKYLDTAGMPDPDLIIRTGGARRLSGFLPWQSVYSELYFTDTLMPDFTVEKYLEALKDYASRQRRFGK